MNTTIPKGLVRRLPRWRKMHPRTGTYQAARKFTQGEELDRQERLFLINYLASWSCADWPSDVAPASQLQLLRAELAGLSIAGTRAQILAWLEAAKRVGIEPI